MRTSIALAVLSGCLLLGCGGDNSEQTDEVSQATTILVTTAMPIKSFSYSSYGLMSYLLTPPAIPPMFLGAIAVQRTSGTGIVTGHITPGSAVNKPGRANLQVSPDIYDNLLEVSTSPGTHSVQIAFDDLTLVPVAIVVR
jgi:hypothetical protein